MILYVFLFRDLILIIHFTAVLFISNKQQRNWSRRWFQDSPDQCPMPINTDQICNIFAISIKIKVRLRMTDYGSIPEFQLALIAIGHWSKESWLCKGCKSLKNGPDYGIPAWAFGPICHINNLIWCHYFKVHVFEWRCFEEPNNMYSFQKLCPVCSVTWLSDGKIWSVLANRKCLNRQGTSSTKLNRHIIMYKDLKDVPGGFPKSDLLGVTVALIHVAAQRFLA